MLASHRIVRYRVVEGFPRYRVGSDGSVWSVWKFGWKRLNPWRDDWGRLRVSFCLGTGRFVRKVSILVLEAFGGPRPEGMECCHKDDNFENNDISNLYWGTRRDNVRDAMRNGRICQGEASHLSKLTVDQVREIRRRWQQEEPRPLQKSLAAQYGIDRSAIGFIVRGKSWKHLL
jgi:hypothetical protein